MAVRAYRILRQQLPSKGMVDSYVVVRRGLALNNTIIDLGFSWIS